jgi:GNAT superfamily N-acetyltransferase
MKKIKETNITLNNTFFRYYYNNEPHKFEKAIEIYNNSFPDNERRPVPYMIKMLETDLSYIYLIEIEGEVAGMATVNPMGGTDFYQLDYLAIEKKYRGLGIGNDFVEFLRDMARNENKSFIIEVEKSDSDDWNDNKNRRIDFYLKLGAKEIKNVYYALPDFDGNGAVPMTLLLMEYPADSIKGTDLFQLIELIYVDFYQRQPDDEILKKIKSKMPDVIHF